MSRGELQPGLEKQNVSYIGLSSRTPLGVLHGPQTDFANLPIHPT